MCLAKKCKAHFLAQSKFTETLVKYDKLRKYFIEIKDFIYTVNMEFTMFCF